MNTSLKRIPLSLKVDPGILEKLSLWAERERRPNSNLAESLLDWALDQMSVAGSLVVLLDWESCPRALKEESEETRAIRLKLEQDLSEEVRRRMGLEKIKNLKGSQSGTTGGKGQRKTS